MFTGIIEETGKIEMLRVGARGASLKVSAKSLSASLRAGDSIAVNGVCLTVTESDAETFGCGLSEETLRRTSFQLAREGADVNLERPLMLDSRLGGHFVSGHVDGIGKLLFSKLGPDGAEMTFGYPPDLGRYLILKGSIAVDGVSLTISSLEETSFGVAVIPHTLKSTNLKSVLGGDSVNLEVDMLGKYVERFCRQELLETIKSRLTIDYLKQQGF